MMELPRKLTTSDLQHLRLAVWGLGRDTTAFLTALERLAPTNRVAIFGDDPLPEEVAKDLRARGHTVLSISPRAAIEEGAFDVIVRSPSVSVYRPELAQAIVKGVLVTTTINLWFAIMRLDRLVIGITGTKGKSTTASLTAHILRALGINALCCGNIGVPLFDPRVEAADVLVAELSSYQLADFTGRVNIGTLLNLYPEHLDWHGGIEAYFRDKKRLFTAQESGDLAILPPELHAVGQHLAASRRVLYFDVPSGYHVAEDGIYYADAKVLNSDASRLPGLHNLRNAAAALTVARAVGGDDDRAAVDAIRSFEPLPHRLQTVGIVDGVTFINDSISTIPEAALAAIDALLPSRVTLIVGGADRGLEWSAFAALLAKRPLNALVALRETGYAVAQALEGLQRDSATAPFSILRAPTLDEAVVMAAQVTPPGGVVLLSPAAPSYNAFRNFEERGAAFCAAVARQTKQRSY